MTLTHEQRVDEAAFRVFIFDQLRPINRSDWDALESKSKDIYRRIAIPIVTAYLAGDLVVPREPTRDMTMNACDRLPSCDHVFGHAGEICASVYRAMIDRQPISWPIPDQPITRP